MIGICRQERGLPELTRMGEELTDGRPEVDQKGQKENKNKTRKGTEKRRQEKNWTATRMSGAKT